MSDYKCNLCHFWLYAFNGCDTTSSFIQRRKAKPLKIVKANHDFLKAFQALGVDETLELKNTVFLGKVCLLPIQQTFCSDVNKLYFGMVNQRFRTNFGKVLSNSFEMDFILLPPRQFTL